MPSNNDEMPRSASTVGLSSVPLVVGVTLLSLCAAAFASWFFVLRTGDDGDSEALGVTDFLSADETPAEVGSPVPQVALDGIDRPAVLMAELRGRIVVMNFWASTCAPCIKEMPLIEDVATSYGDDVAFVGVSVNEDIDDARDMIEQTGVTYSQTRDPDGTIVRQFGGIALPHTVVIDSEGVVVSLNNKVISDRAELTSLIDAAS